jgi:hypothetical protein
MHHLFFYMVRKIAKDTILPLSSLKSIRHSNYSLKNRPSEKIVVRGEGGMASRRLGD